MKRNIISVPSGIMLYPADQCIAGGRLQQHYAEPAYHINSILRFL